MSVHWFSGGHVHVTPEKFEYGVFNLKTHEMFSLRKHIKCFHSENTSNVFTLKTHQMFSLWKHIKCFHSENTSNVFRPHCAGEFWKSSNHLSFCICVGVKLEKGNQMIIVPTLDQQQFHSQNNNRKTCQQIHYCVCISTYLHRRARTSWN